MPELSKGSARALQDAWAGIGSFFSLFACFGDCAGLFILFSWVQRGPLRQSCRAIELPEPRNSSGFALPDPQFKEILEGFFRGQLIIGLMMGLGYAVGFSFSGLKFGITLGLFLEFLNIVPFLGTILGMVLRLCRFLSANGRDFG